MPRSYEWDIVPHSEYFWRDVCDVVIFVSSRKSTNDVGM
jgi:hypothetical protein